MATGWPANCSRRRPATATPSLGWPEAGRLAPGAVADLVTVDLDSPRLAGTDAVTADASVVFAATSADVRQVVVGGRQVVRDGVHLAVPDLAGAYRAALAQVAS